MEISHTIAGPVFKCVNKKCSHIFSLDDIITGRPSGRVFFVHDRSTCPKCRSVAKALEGIYATLPDGKTVLVAGPPSTFEAFTSLVNILESAKRGASEEAIIEQLKHLPSSASETLIEFLKLNGLARFVIVLAVLLTSCGIKVAFDGNWLFEQVMYHFAGHEPTPGFGESKSTKPSQSEKSGEPASSPVKYPEDHTSTPSLDDNSSLPDLAPTPSHHKLRKSKRQKRRDAQRTYPKRR